MFWFCGKEWEWMKERRMLLIGVKWCVIIGITLLWGKGVVGVIGEMNDLLLDYWKQLLFHSMGIPPF